MSQSANVRSIDAIKDFRVAYCRFAEDAKNALGAVDMQLRRALDWLMHERPAYWQMEIKRRKEDLSEAQSELFRRKLQARPGNEIRDTEQKENVRLAKRRLEEAEDKLATVKKWVPVFQHAVSEYQSRARPTADMLEGELKLALALLDRMTAALDSYIATAPPSVAAAEPTAVTSSSAPVVGAPPPSASRGGEGEAAPAAPETLQEPATPEDDSTAASAEQSAAAADRAEG